MGREGEKWSRKGGEKRGIDEVNGNENTGKMHSRSKKKKVTAMSRSS